MTDIVERLQEAMHEESALHAPRTTKAIEAMREAKAMIELLTGAHEHIIEWSRANAFSADAKRHVIEQVAKISRAALEQKS